MVDKQKGNEILTIIDLGTQQNGQYAEDRVVELQSKNLFLSILLLGVQKHYGSLFYGYSGNLLFIRTQHYCLQKGNVKKPFHSLYRYSISTLCQYKYYLKLGMVCQIH